ncbi:hypothetical protein L1049_010261 [Liquidambar formosana]|uniref:Zinc finger LSD1-type domain-containing protein n=1 Tax=Liquidambar formosana TaxID=63359 RepID=A0AAP0R463_LIQFO
MGSKQVEEDEGPPPGWQTTPPPPPPQPPPPPSDMAQMVCGSCHRLLSYPRGARHVQCSSCQTVNFVLEAQQVGQVKCAGCAVLLMYPYGAPSVRCSSCRSVTEIGAPNRRPPLSVQQANSLSAQLGQQPPPSNPVH